VRGGESSSGTAADGGIAASTQITPIFSWHLMTTYTDFAAGLLIVLTSVHVSQAYEQLVCVTALQQCPMIIRILIIHNGNCFYIVIRTL
jgi:hypothetical protein